MGSFFECIAYSFQCLEIRDLLSDSEDLQKEEKDGKLTFKWQDIKIVDIQI